MTRTDIACFVLAVVFMFALGLELFIGYTGGM